MDCEACGKENLAGARFCANCGVTLPIEGDERNAMIGKTVGGRYRITGVIGEGGMGIVYSGEQQMGTAVRKVAIKTLHAELSQDPSVTARFHRECGTVAHLEHPNTIRVYDFGTMDDGTLYIAMEFLEGNSLDKVISEAGALEPQRVIRVMRQVSGSLDEAHRQGVIHRDLKPENVILVERAGEADTVKLLDFGIAARTESADAEREAKLTQQGTVLGTPPYMSPEQFTGKALDKRSDIYSLAVMAYEMLTGNLPFSANTPWEWATQHMTAQPRPFETMEVSTSIPKPMRDAILRALSKDRTERFADVPTFVEALAAPERVTVASTAQGADVSQPTAVMEAAPNFGGAAVNAPTAAMPVQGSGGAGAPVAAPTAAMPAAPSRQGASGQGKGKGLVVGLGAVALLLAGGLVLAMSGGDQEEEAQLIALPSAQTQPPEPAASPTPEAPAVPDEPESKEEETPSVNAPVRRPTSKAPAKQPKPQVTKPKPADRPKPSERPKPAPKPDEPASKPPPKPPASDACKQCVQLVKRGQFSSAAGHYRSCTDSAKRGLCTKMARVSARKYGTRAARTGDCTKARQIQATARAMGASDPSLDAAVAKCKN